MKFSHRKNCSHEIVLFKVFQHFDSRNMFSGSAFSLFVLLLAETIQSDIKRSKKETTSLQNKYKRTKWKSLEARNEFKTNFSLVTSLYVSRANRIITLFRDFVSNYKTLRSFPAKSFVAPRFSVICCLSFKIWFASLHCMRAPVTTTTRCNNSSSAAVDKRQLLINYMLNAMVWFHCEYFVSLIFEIAIFAVGQKYFWIWNQICLRFFLVFCLCSMRKKPNVICISWEKWSDFTSKKQFVKLIIKMVFHFTNDPFGICSIFSHSFSSHWRVNKFSDGFWKFETKERNKTSDKEAEKKECL